MKRVLLMVLLSVSNVYAGGLPAVGSGFSYQGELINNGSTVDGFYDFEFRLYTAQTGGVPSSNIVSKSPVMVSNGLFTIDNIDFGDNVFVGSEQWLEIKVKPTSSGAFVALSPLQRIGAVPYAVQAEYLSSTGASTDDVLKFNGVNWMPSLIVPHATLADKASDLSIVGAANGDVLQFNGSNWVANALSSGSSPWVINGNDISYTQGNVGINIAAPGSQLTV